MRIRDIRIGYIPPERYGTVEASDLWLSHTNFRQIYQLLFNSQQHNYSTSLTLNILLEK
jgi:hypothetical protein